MNSLKNIFSNNRNDVNYINGTTSRVSVLVEDISYQFERKLGSNVINVVGSNDCAFEISQDQVVRLDQEFIINSECRTVRTERLCEFKKVSMRFAKRTRPYDERRLGDEDITSEEVVRIFKDMDCDHILGNFFFVAHLADCIGIAHVGYNAYSKQDTLAACRTISAFPLTFASVRKTLNVSSAWLDVALRKLESNPDYGMYRTTLIRGDVYKTRPLELFAPKIIDMLRTVDINYPAETIRYVSPKEMIEFIGSDAPSNNLWRLGINPSKRRRGQYLLCDGLDRNRAINEFPYTLQDIADTTKASISLLYKLINEGVVNEKDTQLVSGASQRRRFNEAAMADLVAGVATRKLRTRVKDADYYGVFY